MSAHDALLYALAFASAATAVFVAVLTLTVALTFLVGLRVQSPPSPKVVFEIRGDKLVAVMREHNRRRGRRGAGDVGAAPTLEPKERGR